MSTRITLVKGTSRTFDIDVIDDNGQLVTPAALVGATAHFTMRTTPAAAADVRYWTSADPLHLEIVGGTLRLKFSASDTSNLAIQAYVYQVTLTLASGAHSAIIEWSPFDLELGGVAEVPAPAFSNTTKLNHDYGLADALKYVTAGGSPITSAQVRVYYKADYDAGRLTTPVGVTETDAYGRWRNPVLVLPGFTYAIQFFKPNEYGPDKIEIVA